MIYPLTSVGHVVPCGDNIEHTTTDPCLCGPSLDLSGDIPKIIHHALDSSLEEVQIDHL